MTLQVIYADEVLDGEPRMYAIDAKNADALRGVLRLRELHKVKLTGYPLAIVDRPTPPSAQPPPVLDLDALDEAERAMTAGLSVEAGSVPLGDTGDYDAYIHIVGRDGRVLVYMNSPEADRSLALAAGIVALRNAAPHLIAEARAAVALRAQICRLVSGQAIESDHLCQHLDADVAALAEVAALRQELAEVAHMLAMATSRYDACVTKLAEARRLGLEACDAAQMSDDQMMWAPINITAIRAALEPL